MRRTNYLLSWSERCAGIALPRTLRPELRAPLAVLGCALALVVLLAAVQHERLRAVAAEGARYADQLGVAETRAARATAAERDVARIRTIAARLDALRSLGAERTAEIVRLGDALPAESWLTSLRADAAALTLEGRGARLSAVARTMADLAALRGYAGARLISLHDDAATPEVGYAIALERRR
jgi:Tfp pilus assembly protein PilN